MVALNPPLCDFGWPAPDFDLPGTDGKRHSLASCRGPNGLLVMFICNHCPYVQAILPRLVEDAAALQALGVGVAAISSNDAAAYPADAFPEMQRLARERAFPFPYLYDETQAVARAYGAVCTPDFFGFDAALALHYRGRFDDTGRGPARPDARRELLAAMRAIAAGDGGPQQQWPSIGCSLKWREEA
ncbi:MAG TPA: thioredoxin family protein [Azospira sp.]|nr:thioredoxin family protein [Azospira sp.]